MDASVVCGDVPVVLCPDDDARLCGGDGSHVPLEQDRLWPGPGWILLGLLVHSDPGGSCE